MDPHVIKEVHACLVGTLEDIRLDRMESLNWIDMYLVSDDVSEYTYSLETVLGAASSALKVIYALFIDNNTNDIDLELVAGHIKAMEEEYPKIIINGEY